MLCFSFVGKNIHRVDHRKESFCLFLHSTKQTNKTKPPMKMFDNISVRGKLLLRAVCRSGSGSGSVPLPSVTTITRPRLRRLRLTWAGVCVCGLRSSSSWWRTRAAAAWGQPVTRTTPSDRCRHHHALHQHHGDTGHPRLDR